MPKNEQESMKRREQLSDFSDEEVSKIREELRQYLVSEGKGWTNKLAEDHIPNKPGYAEDSLKRVVKLIGREMEEKGEIQYEKEGASGIATRKVWVYQGDT